MLIEIHYETNKTIFSANQIIVECSHKKTTPKQNKLHESCYKCL